MFVFLSPTKTMKKPAKKPTKYITEKEADKMLKPANPKAIQRVCQPMIIAIPPNTSKIITKGRRKLGTPIASIQPAVAP